MLNFLSWGKGVQSTALLIASIRGDWGLPRLDAVFHSDTQWERQRTLETGDFYKSMAQAAGVPVIETTAGSVEKQGVDEHIHVPLYTSSGAPLRRMCSRHFKLRPIRRSVRRFLGCPESVPPHPPAGSARMWIGFSLDEWRRCDNVWKYGGVQYLEDSFPLIERRLSRRDCIQYFEDLGLPVPVKSSCVGCPYRSASEWIVMQGQAPGEFIRACEFDERVRNNPLADIAPVESPELYIWRDLVPLWEVDFQIAAERERLGVQLPMFVQGVVW